MEQETSVERPVAENGPRFAICHRGIWFDDMVGTRDTGGSNYNYGGVYDVEMNYIAIEGVGDYRVCTSKNGWLPYVNGFDKNDRENGMAGDGSRILAIEIPNCKVRFSCHTISGEWLPYMIGQYDTGGSSKTYCGDMNPIDCIQIMWA